MTDKISLLNMKKAKIIEQTMLLLTKTSPVLIKALVRYMLFNSKPTDFNEFKHPAIYLPRAKTTFIDTRDKVITLAGLYSPLYGIEKKFVEEGQHDPEPFSLIVNVEDTDFKKGFVWYSPSTGKSYSAGELEYFVLTDEGFTPFNIFPTKKCR